MKEAERSYLQTIAELQELARQAPFVTQEWILQVASMDVADMRRRLIRNYDWHSRFAHVLDGINEIKAIPGRAPDGCWDPGTIRSVVEQLVAACPVTWEKSWVGDKKGNANAGCDKGTKQQRSERSSE